MEGTITIPVALLVLLSSQAAMWVKIYLDAKSLKKASLVALRAEPSIITTVATPPCTAEMVKEHIEKLAKHSAEIAGLQDSLAILRTENIDGHDKIETKLDKILIATTRTSARQDARDEREQRA